MFYPGLSLRGRPTYFLRLKGNTMNLKIERDKLNSDLCSGFQRVAEACGGDILQACRDCGEPEVIERDGLMDYLTIYGGEEGQTAWDWIDSYKGTWEELNRELDARGVPQTWA